MPRRMRRTRRLARILLNAMTAMSLVLCAATAAMWIRAQWANDRLVYTWIGSDGGVPAVRGVWSATWRGSVTFGAASNPIRSDDLANARALAADPASDFGIEAASRQALSYTIWVRTDANDVQAWTHWGFGWERWSYTVKPRVLSGLTMGDEGRSVGVTGGRKTEFALPWWALAIAFAVLPALAVRRYVHKRRRQPGTCPGCGYDLRATPDRCPECGAVAPPQPA
jgi:hypothetical protein